MLTAGRNFLTVNSSDVVAGFPFDGTKLWVAVCIPAGQRGRADGRKTFSLWMMTGSLASAELNT
jgi:hypothetical protein